MPDETTLLRFRHLLEKHQLALQLLAAINTGLARKGLMHKTGSIVNADSGLLHTVIVTAVNVNDVTQAAGLLHGKEKHAWGDAGYQGVDKRQELQGSKTKWHVAMRPGKSKALDLKQEQHKLLDKAGKIKASVRAKVEHAFRVLKQQFGCAKLRYRGLQKNTDRLMMLFALGNLWMVRKRIMALQV